MKFFRCFTITTVEGQRVEIPSSHSPRPPMPSFSASSKNGAEFGVFRGSQTLFRRLHAGAHAARATGLSECFSSKTTRPAPTPTAIWKCSRLWPTSAAVRWNVSGPSRICARAGKRFRDLFENSPDAIFVEGLDGVVLDVNFAACVLHGLTREQLIGKMP